MIHLIFSVQSKNSLYQLCSFLRKTLTNIEEFESKSDLENLNEKGVKMAIDCLLKHFDDKRRWVSNNLIFTLLNGLEETLKLVIDDFQNLSPQLDDSTRKALNNKLKILDAIGYFCNMIITVLGRIYKLIAKFRATSHPNEDEILNIIINWNKEINKNIRYFKEALTAFKEAKTKVSDTEMSDKFVNLSTHTVNVIEYFQNGLKGKLIVNSGNEKITLKKIGIDV